MQFNHFIDNILFEGPNIQNAFFLLSASGSGSDIGGGARGHRHPVGHPGNSICIYWLGQVRIGKHRSYMSKLVIRIG